MDGANDFVSFYIGVLILLRDGPLLHSFRILYAVVGRDVDCRPIDREQGSKSLPFLRELSL